MQKASNSRRYKTECETGCPEKNGTEKKTVSIATAVIILLFLSISAYFAISISFSSSPSISPNTDKRPDTNDTLTCSWNASIDVTQQNVSWFKNGVSFKNETDVLVFYSTINPENTSRGEIWNCTIILSNGTDFVIQSTNMTIKNAVPTTPMMVNSSGNDIGNSTAVTEDIVNVFNISAEDPDGDNITYGNLGSLPNGASLDSDTGRFTWTPAYTNTETNITFYATDSYGDNPGITTKKVLFTIDYVNDAPQFSPALSNQIINESQTLNYQIIGSDEENNLPLNFSISVSPSLSLLVNLTSNSTAMIMFEGNRTAAYSEAGNYTVNITVYDSLGANITSSFNLTINQVNLAPTLREILNKSGVQGENLTFYVYADDADENNTLSFNIFNITPLGCPEGNPWNITTVNSSSNATGLVNISELTNEHVICNYVRITVIDDNGAEDYQDVFLNISNTNDPPNIGVLSSYINNTGGENISNLTAYAESPFVYLVNASDIDNSTYEGEVLSYSDNTTLFDINSSTGLISFTPEQSAIGNHTINITVTDDGSPNSGTPLSSSIVMVLFVINNSAPVLSSIGNLSCAEDSLCFLVFNGTDANGDNITFSSNSSAVFNLTNNNSEIPIRSAFINYTPNQSQVGVYSIFVQAQDIRGATDNETIMFQINNTNDAPVLQSFSFSSKIVEAHATSVYVYADDQDYELPSIYATLDFNGTNVTEYVNFSSTNVSGKSLFSINNYFNSSSNKTYGRIVFTPQIGDAGNYSVNITAVDHTGAMDSLIRNFTVLNKTNPPNITQIMPYGTPYSEVTVFNFTNASNYATSFTQVNFTENRSVIYNVSVIDDTTAAENLTCNWYVDGELNSTDPFLNLSYNFFSSGNYEIKVVVEDDMYENANWTWNVTVTNLNRMPTLIHPLNNISVNTTTLYTDYFKESIYTHFLDPDDDLNSNNEFDPNETSSLSYELDGICEAAGLEITDNSLRVTPQIEGNCLVAFTASDSGGLSYPSGYVTVNITAVPNSTDESPSPSSGGGGGTSRSIVVPITKQEEKPQVIEIIVPQIVNIYENKSVLIPVILQNNWNTSLEGVWINATTNESNVNISISENYFEEIKKQEQKNITITVNNYRFGDNYEVKITANVTTPKASDSATVMLNSIEQSQSGEDVQTKVTFAQDLLNDNPECAELNELLLESIKALEEGDSAKASKMIDGVINGCKYLVSIARKEEQKPELIISKFLKKENLKYILVFIGIIGLGSMAVLVTRKGKQLKHEKKKVEEQKKEDEVKPYWQ